MSPATLYLSFDGRLDRWRWLRAVSVLAAAVVATYLGTWVLFRYGLISAFAREASRAFVQIGLLVPWFALDWKRFQDHDIPGRWALLCPALLIFGRVLELPGVRVPAHGFFTSLLAWLQLAVALALAYLLAWRRGVPGPNRFGPDPRALPVGARKEAR